MEHRNRPHTRRTITIRLCANRRQRDLIDQAANTLGKSRSDFIVDVACREAEHVLLDRTDIKLDPMAFERFRALLNDPPPPTDELRRLMHRKGPWE